MGKIETVFFFLRQCGLLTFIQYEEKLLNTLFWYSCVIMQLRKKITEIEVKGGLQITLNHVILFFYQPTR